MYTYIYRLNYIYIYINTDTMKEIKISNLVFESAGYVYFRGWREDWKKKNCNYILISIIKNV